MQYILAINVGRQYSDRCDPVVIARNVQSRLTANGFGFAHEPQFRVQVTPDSRLDVFSLSRPRGTAIIALAVTATSLDPAKVRDIDVVCLQSIFESAQAPSGEDWDIRNILSRLPSNGSGSGRLAFLGRDGEPTEVSRSITAGQAPPIPQATNPVITQEVQRTNEPDVSVGQTVPSATADLATRASNGAVALWESNKPLVIVGGVVVGLVATAVIATQVKGLLK